MEITKQGNLNQNTQIERYNLRCPNCGCEFTADSNESCGVDKTMYGTKIRFRCPECGTEVECGRMNESALFEDRK